MFISITKAPFLPRLQDLWLWQPYVASGYWPCDLGKWLLVIYPLVNIQYKKLWKDPPCYQWVNPLFLSISTGPCSIAIYVSHNQRLVATYISHVKPDFWDLLISHCLLAELTIYFTDQIPKSKKNICLYNIWLYSIDILPIDSPCLMWLSI